MLPDSIAELGGVPDPRTVKTASGATAAQVAYFSRRGSPDIEHIESAHDAAELEVLKAVAPQRAAAGPGAHPSDLCLATAKRDSPIRAADGWTARQARAANPRRWRAMLAALAHWEKRCR
jgi:hypothetical protein